MGTQEWLVERFRALCKRVGGVDAVAEATGLSAESLSQVIKGYRLQGSKNPRGLGPTAIRKLDLAYPDWYRQEPAAGEVTNQAGAKAKAAPTWPFETITPDQWLNQLTERQRGAAEDAAKQVVDRCVGEYIKRRANQR